MTTEAEIEVMKLQAGGYHGCRSNQQPGRGKAGCSPTQFRGTWPCQYLNLDL